MRPGLLAWGSDPQFKTLNPVSLRFETGTTLQTPYTACPSIAKALDDHGAPAPHGGAWPGSQCGEASENQIEFGGLQIFGCRNGE